MTDSGDNGKMSGRRRFLLVATSVAGAVAGAGVATPFLRSMMPSERAKAAGAPVEVDISKLEPGMLLTAEWRGKVVWVLKRTPEMLDNLEKLNSQLADPDSQRDQQPPYAQNHTRSIKPEILVVLGVCTHLGCSPVYRKDIAPADLGSDWLGGFFCPCHGSKFDLAGRVYKSVPAPSNLVVPPYTYLSDNRLLVGSDSKESA
ncbi:MULTISPECIES: ubiquinol-cytochrome c reductase iron-sulfur subunit [Nitrosomonas]|uniref:Ubiquinol-cytochrome c reductase iron-sulfur subunit n=1 Tax=Nitrosomonas europaea (strain ATCC 19718 / CIP 103999 / KCTC 2705 / NBRC 14298) TaxID=228410 RepID=Q82W85_NITEU|nr:MULTISPECIES: ubiquinol-cytochrome c reductase iron-sulfur subunit [Nitrosomonas]MCE7917109.1 ubiquinol-cytochrome c reductase iron-sulfur subunit [Nitrosomonas sp. PRO5]KXK46005.1 MAG: Rieske iron-sulfur protein 2Fe-2S subunit [Nitrosomonas europaea]MBV6389974.1 Ubiquinol-cytochrome c reductase iron-sulfur subunit [Nitrosomonas europaea]MEB2331358.1 ubiquinol-cytochrome c reductase iron-sulfur subunit [Nitrosomonas sp.]QOJ08778.1 MAG: ubiquinol-cytochrome c reductase iron-sulfur subunit [N